MREVAGIDEINRQMQILFNPKSPQKNQMKVGTTIFRENDKVMLLKNLPDEDEKAVVKSDGLVFKITEVSGNVIRKVEITRDEQAQTDNAQAQE